MLDIVVAHLYIAIIHMALPIISTQELKKGSAEMLIMALVEERARHGYEIAGLIGERSKGALKFHAASLYPLLYRMEERGWIKGKWIEKTGHRRRRYYTLTAKGRKALALQRNTWQQFFLALNRVARLSPK